jgi:hypothetical protein
MELLFTQHAPIDLFRGTPVECFSGSSVESLGDSGSAATKSYDTPEGETSTHSTQQNVALHVWSDPGRKISALTEIQ